MLLLGSPTCPDKANLPNLDVMEIDPAATMQAELDNWTEFAKELGVGAAGGEGEGEGEDGGLGSQIKSFQEWLRCCVRFFPTPNIFYFKQVTLTRTHVHSTPYHGQRHPGHR